MNYSDYPHGFDHGVTIHNIPVNTVVNPKANVFWVDSVNGSNQNKGTRARPFATLDYAIGKCTANNGDIIYVAAGHTETVIAASGVTFDIAGVTAVFLGEGAKRARISLGTDVAASVVISAANVTLVNPVFVSDIDALTGPISITGADCKIVNAEWYDAAAKAATNGIVATNTATRLTIDGYKYFVSTTGTQKATHIKIADNASPVLKNIDIRGDFSTAPINATAAATNVLFENIYLQNTNVTPKPGMDIHANTTGIAKNIDIRIASGTAYVSSVAKLNWDNSALGYNADGYGGDPIGTAATVSVEGKIDAIPTQIGSEFWVKKTLVSSAIVQAGVDITGVSATGELAVQDIIVKTDSTGLANGTNFEITSNNTNGLANIFVETVANLGANKTMDLTGASVTKIRTVIETGKKLIAKSTVADCTGAGTIDIYIKFQRITAGATIAAA